MTFLHLHFSDCRCQDAHHHRLLIVPNRRLFPLEGQINSTPPSAFDAVSAADKAPRAIDGLGFHFGHDFDVDA